jgi:hypothetical protein
MARLFTVEASARYISTWHGEIPLESSRRPPTFCAHRLRKPDRMCEPLTLSVTRRPRRWAGSDPRLQVTPRQARRDRRRVRTPDIEQTRTPSVGSTPRLAVREVDFALVVYLHALYPAPCRLLQERPASSKAGVFLQAIRPFPTASCLASGSDQKDAPDQLLQPTLETRTLWTVRFPSTPPERPCGPSLGDPRMKPRLTTTLQLWHSNDSPEQASRTVALMPPE